MSPDDIPTEITKLVYTLPLANSRAVSQNETAALLAHFWPAIEAHIRAQEPVQPSSDHMAVYLDQHGQVWCDYPTSPPGDAVLPLVWASEKARSKEDLEDRGLELRVIGWCQ